MLRRVPVRGRDGAVGGRIEARRAAAEPPGGARPQRRVAAPLVEVPAGAAAGRPDRAGHGPLHAAVPGGLGVLANLDDVARPLDVADGVGGVGDLGLDHEYLGAVTEAGVGPDQEEEVREAGHRGALVGLHPLGPALLQRHPLAADDPVGDGDVGDVEARPEDDRVDRVLRAVGGHHRPRPHFGQPLGHEVDVGLAERRQVVVGDQDPLAADAVVGGQLGPQHRIGDRPGQVPAGQAFGGPHQVRGRDEAGHHLLPAPVDPGPGQALHQRHVAEHPLLRWGEAAVPAGQDPRRCPLEDREVPHPGLDLGHELDGRRTGADDRHPPPGQVVVVAPLGGVEHRALELVEAGKRRDGRVGQGAGGRDEHFGFELAAAGPHPPAPVGVVPGGAEHLVREADVGPYAEVGGHPSQVLLDLDLRREGAAPVGIGGEGERVEVGGDVAGRAGIGVVPPGAADLAGPFHNGEFILGDTPRPPGDEAGLLEADGHAEAGEARPHDQDTRALHWRRHRPSLRSLRSSLSHRPTAFHSILENGVTRPSSTKSLRVLLTESFSS